MGLFSKVFGFVEDIFSAIGDVFSWMLGIPDEDEYEGQLLNKSSNVANIPVIYGKRLVGGTRAFVSTGGNKKNQYMYIVLALSEGEVESIDKIYVNDKIQAGSAVSGKPYKKVTTGDYKDIIWYQTFTGTESQTACTTLFNDIGGQGPDDSWTSAHKLNGVAYIAMVVRYHQDKGMTSIPEIRCEVKGRRVYNPDTGVTEWTDNPALCLRDYLTNTRYGKGLPASAIDDDAFIAAASFCATPKDSYTNGPQVNVFSLNAIIDTSKTIFKNTQKILTAMRGIMPYTEGKYSILIDKDEESVGTITSDIVTKDISIKSTSKDKKLNQAKVVFVNPYKRWEKDHVIYPAANSAEETQFLAEDNNQILSKEITLDTVTNFYQARELARVIVLSSRSTSMMVSVICTSEALQYAVGDVIKLENESMGWTDGAEKSFRIMSMQLSVDGQVGLTLQEYDSQIYPWVVSTQEDDQPETTLPNPSFVDPVINASATAGAQVLTDGTTQYYLDFEWDAPDDALVSEYNVEVTKKVGLVTTNNIETITTRANKARYIVTDTDAEYGFVVKAVNGASSVSDGFTVTPVATIADTTAPGDITGLSATGGLQSISLSWTNPTDADFDLVNIKVSDDDDVEPANVFAQVRTNSYIYDVNSYSTTKYFWVAPVDRTGNTGSYTGPESATTGSINYSDVGNTPTIPEVATTVYLTLADSDAPTDAEFSTAVGRDPIENDFVVVSYTVETVTNTKAYVYKTVAPAIEPDWTEVTEYIDGSMIVTGSLSASDITTGTLNANDVTISNLTIGYGSVTDTPTIPSAVSELTNDTGFVTSVAWNELTGTAPAVSTFNNDSSFITSDDVPSNPQWWSLSGRDETTAPSDADFNTAFSRNPVKGDVLLITDTGGDTANYQYSGTAWTSISALIRGDMLVQGTVNADRIEVDGTSASVTIDGDTGTPILVQSDGSTVFSVSDLGDVTMNGAYISGIPVTAIPTFESDVRAVVGAVVVDALVPATPVEYTEQDFPTNLLSSLKILDTGQSAYASDYSYNLVLRIDDSWTYEYTSEDDKQGGQELYYFVEGYNSVTEVWETVLAEQTYTTPVFYKFPRGGSPQELYVIDITETVANIPSYYTGFRVWFRGVDKSEDHFANFEFTPYMTVKSGSSGFIPEDISVTSGTATGGGSLSYNNQGEFTFAPADVSSFVTQTDINNSISSLVDSAPDTLDTLNELAAALGDDANFSTTVTDSIATKASKSGDTFTGVLKLNDELQFLRGSSEYSNYIRAQNYPSQGFTSSTQKYWLEYGSKGGQHFVLNTDGGAGNAENDFDHFTIWQGAVDGDKLLSVSNTGNVVIAGTLSASGYNASNWDTAYGWGNHASAGYLTSIPSEYLTQTEGDARYALPSSVLQTVYQKEMNTSAAGYVSFEFTGYVNTIGRDFYIFDVIGYKDFRDAKSFVHYTVYLNCKGAFGGALADNTITADVIAHNQSDDANLTFKLERNLTPDNKHKLWIGIDEGYSGIQILHYPTYIGDLTRVSSSDFDFTSTEPTTTTVFEPSIPVLSTGATFTGDVKIEKTSPTLTLKDSNSATGSYPKINFDTTNNQGVTLYHTEFDSELPVGGYGLVLDASAGNAQYPTTGELAFVVKGEIYAGDTTLGSTNKVYHAGNFTDNSSNWNTAYTYSQVGHLPLTGGTLTGDLTISSTSPELKLVDTNGFTDANDRMIFRASADNALWQWYDNSETTTTTLMTLDSDGDLTVNGDFTTGSGGDISTGQYANITSYGNVKATNGVFQVGSNTVIDNARNATFVDGTFTGSIESSVNMATTSGNGVFDVSKTLLGNMHFTNGNGANGSPLEAGITWQGSSATQAQAGIYVVNDDSSGTHMAFATTNSYNTGPQIGLSITNYGVVDFPRSRPTYGGNGLWSSGDFSSSQITNWDTAYTYSQVGHLPKAGGTMTGNINFTASDVGIAYTGHSGIYMEGKRALWSHNNGHVTLAGAGGDLYLGYNSGSDYVTGLITLHADTHNANKTIKIIDHDTGRVWSEGSRTFADNYHPNADKWTTARSHTVTLTGDVTGSATQSVDGTGNKTWSISTAVGNDSHTHDTRYQKRFTASKAINASTYTTIATVNGDGLASGVNMHISGTSGSVVINVNAQILVNHSTDIMIKTDSGIYTQLYIKVTSTNNEDFAIEVKRVSGSGDTNVAIEISPLSNETIAFPTSHSYTGASLEIETKAGSVSKGTGGSNYNYRTDGVMYVSNTQRVFADDYHPNADKWTTARTLSLTGDVTGSVSWDGSANASITATVANDSHTHDGRYYTESEADSRFANITGDTFTGNLKVDGGFFENFGITYLRDNLRFINSGANGWHTIIEKNGGNPYFNAIDSYRVNGSTVIDSSRNLTNIGTITTNASATSDMFWLERNDTSGITSTLRNNTGGNTLRLYGDYANNGSLCELQIQSGQNGDYAQVGTWTNQSLYLKTNNTNRLEVQNNGYVKTYNGLQVFRNLGNQIGGWPDGEHTLSLENSDAGWLSINFHRAGYTSDSLYCTGSSFNFTDNLNLTSGGYQINGTTVIDSSRNLTNIANVSTNGGALKIAQYASNGYLYCNNWIHPADGTGLFYDNGTHSYSNAAGSMLLHRGSGSVYHAIRAETNNWKFVRLEGSSGAVKWDIATKEDDLSGSLQFRPAGSATNRAYLTTTGDFVASRDVYALRQFVGGMGAVTTSGNTDWNNSTNARSGNGYTLLLGTHSNGFGESNYYHPFTFEYSSKNGNGNMTQFAIPYSGGSVWFRSRYSGSWDTWGRILDSRSDWKMGSTTVVNTSRKLVNTIGLEVSGTNIIDSSGSLGVKNSSSTTGKGLSLYGGAVAGMPTYGMAFAGTATFGGYGFLQGDWATYFTTSNTVSRGWIFRRGSSNVASINGYGDAYFGGVVNAQGSLRVGNTTVIDSSRNLTNINSITALGGSLLVSKPVSATAVINGHDAYHGIQLRGEPTGASTHTASDVMSFYEYGGVFKFFKRIPTGLTLQVTFSDGSITATGNITAYSDRRLKDNIKTLDGSKVYEMRGVSFTKDGEQGSGVIAQELEQVAPELVMTNDDEMQTKSVAYGNVVGYLIEAIKELKQEIEELKNVNSN